MKKELIIPSVACFSAYISSTPEGADIENTCDWHIHPELELFLLTSGKRIFSIGQEDICLSVEDIIFINSRVPHKVYASEGSRGILLQFQTESSTENSFYQNALELLGKREEAFAFFNKTHPLHETLSLCIKNIWNEYHQRDVSHHAFIKAYIHELFAHLYRSGILKDPDECLDVKKLEKLLPALEYIHLHYTESISLEDMSRCLLSDKSYVCRLFKRTLGTSFVEYLNYVRSSKAHTLLLSTNKSISEIAYETGFSSEAYFIRCFKKYYFCTPLTCRKLSSNLPK